VAVKAAGSIHSANLGPSADADPPGNDRRQFKKLRFYVSANTKVTSIVALRPRLGTMAGFCRL
jgi:hypothetical protein